MGGDEKPKREKPVAGLTREVVSWEGREGGGEDYGDMGDERMYVKPKPRKIVPKKDEA